MIVEIGMSNGQVCKRKFKRGTYCAASWCSNFFRCRVGGQPLSLFSFPKDPERAKEWVKFTLREDLQGRSLKYLRLCSDHFLNSDIRTKYPRVLLYPNAIPSRVEYDPDEARVFIESCSTNDAVKRSSEVTSGDKSSSTEISENVSDVMGEGLCPPDGRDSGDKRPRLEVDGLGDVTMEGTTPPHEALSPSHEDSGDPWGHDGGDLVASTLDGIEMEPMSDQERIVKHGYECCRLCLQMSEQLTDVSMCTRLGLVVREAVKDLLRFEVVTKDGSPWHVCYLCMQKLSEFQEFRDRCIESKDVWEDCIEREEGIRSKHNHRKNELQHEENTSMKEVHRNESAIYDEEHNETDAITDVTLNALCSGEIKDEVVTTDGNEPGGCNPEKCEINGCTLTDSTTEIKQEVYSEAGDIRLEENTPVDDNSSEIGGREVESSDVPSNTLWAKSEYITGDSRMWYKFKGDVTSAQVSKGSIDTGGVSGRKSPEPLVWVLKADGGVELCTMSEVPPDVKEGIQRCRKKKKGALEVFGPSDKGDRRKERIIDSFSGGMGSP